MTLAPRSDRVTGQIIDGVIAVGPFLLILAFRESFGAIGTILVQLSMLFAVAHYFICDALPNGQSYGKRIMNMRVIDEDSGRPCSFFQSAVRNFSLGLLGPLDWIFIFGEKRQRLGDKMMGTIVVST